MSLLLRNLALATLLVAQPVLAQDADGWRTVDIETTEVTAPDVAITPDGQTLIFTLLGHLFRLPVEGGDAEQLTFGPHYDARPAVSPDGARVAFQSDRDGSEGNIFLLDLASREITQLTDEPWADSPSWAPDGESVVYLRLVREAWNTSDAGPNRNPRRPPPPATVRRVRLDGNEPETLRTEVSEVRSPFHLPGGRVGWAVVQRDTASPRATTRIEVMGSDGLPSTIRVLDGVVGALVPSEEAFFARRYVPLFMRHEIPQQHEIVRIPYGEGAERLVMPVSYIRGKARFTRADSDGALYVGNRGRLWKVAPDEGAREEIPFRATVRMEILDPVLPPTWTLPQPGASRPPISIRFPRLSPDGRHLVYLAARYLWAQPLGGGPIRRLSTTSTREPTFSPDGGRVAFLADSELRVFDMASGETQTVLRSEDLTSPAWARDGERLIVVRDLDPQTFHLVSIDLGDGATDTLAELEGNFLDRAPVSISPDGQWLYLVAADVPGGPSVATLFRYSLLDPRATPEPFAQLAMEFAYGRVAPNGQWFAYRPANRLEIRLVPLGAELVSAADSRLLSAVGGITDFAFTHDGSAVIYAGPGAGVWLHPVAGDEPEEIPVRVELERPAPPPTLIRRVRILDLGTGGFGPETSMLIEDGRIRWTGNERELPPGTVTLDGAGRFAIPGMFDMHGHSQNCRGNAGRRNLTHGVTSVRNVGGPVVEVGQAADREWTGYPAPHCFYAGYLIDGEQGRNGDWGFIHPTDEADVRSQVRSMRDWGASFIKLYYVLPWPLHRAAADEARQLGLPVLAHGADSEQVVKGVRLGYLLTHGTRLAYDDLLHLLAGVGMRTDPTLGVPGRGQHVLRLREPERFSDSQPIYPLGDDALLGSWTKHLASVHRAYELGVTILPGTDWGPSGWTLQLELEFFAEAGIPPIDILRFATQASAETVGAGDELGTLEVGKLADIVLLDANPLEDIKNTQAIWRVIKGGVVFDPEELMPPSGN